MNPTKLFMNLWNAEKEKSKRRERADNILVHVDDYLEDCGWRTCDTTLFRVDPITGTRYPTDTAFVVQLSRDLNV
jgi:hypothetical protein